MECSKFIEEDYLRANPDVSNAVRKGEFFSGFDHFQKFGRVEGRKGAPGLQEDLCRKVNQKRLTLSRNGKILSSVRKNIPGLEIGPSHRPVAPKRGGFNVKILDHLTAGGLREKYRDHGVDIDAIEEVDYVWSGGHNRVRLDIWAFTRPHSAIARKPGVHLPGGYYHVMIRGNGGQDIFFSDKDRTRFLLLVQEGIERYGHRVHCFCLMGNHVHLLIQVGAEPLSKILSRHR